MSLESPETNNPKQREWEEVLHSLDTVVDKLKMPIDAGIKETVATLKCTGFEPRASCEGHPERGVRAPWVDLSFMSEERRKQYADQIQEADSRDDKEKIRSEAKMEMLAGAERLMGLLDEFYRDKNTNFTRRLTMRFFPDSVRLYSQGAELQDLHSPQGRKERLKEFQEEMADFAAFVKQDFVSRP